MPAAPIPSNEPARLAALDACLILDTQPEPAFDDIVELARHVCDVPIALVSIVDRDRQWFKARIGFPEPETPRDRSFCAHALLGESPLVVEDACRDPRFADNPLVTGEPHLRFYMGVPIRVDGATLGTLCVLDRVPRQLTEAQKAALAALARRVEREVVLRREAESTRNGRVVDPLRALLSGDASPPVLSPGARVLDRYDVHGEIASGGMGAVFEALDTKTNERVAVKTLTRVAADPTTIARFVREGRALKALEHENVARILDAGNIPGGAPCIVMELLDATITVAARGKGPYAIADLVRQASRGVAAAHAQGIVHRDIKPGNLLVRMLANGECVVKVVDFGIAKLAARHLGGEGAVTSEGDVIGSPHYMAPEQMLASRDVGPAADVWSLGVVLFELLAGEPPFTGTMAAICARVFTSNAPSVREHRPEVDEALDAIVRRCLQRDPASRFADGGHLEDALADAIAARRR